MVPLKVTSMHYDVLSSMWLTQKCGLLLQPKFNNDGFYLKGISDSEYAGDQDKQISVYGYILYFCGAPIASKFKHGKYDKISSTEAEYYSTSEIAKEVIFAKIY
jgi:hypothetical protein